MRRVPLVPTLVVAVAIAIMLALGFWQLLIRAPQKEALLARYAGAETASAEVPWPGSDERAAEPLLYRRSRLDCRSVTGTESIAGRSAADEAGIAHVARCTLADGSTARVVLGWSRDPAAPAWTGGAVAGIIAPGPRLVADPPLAGLAASARPDPRDLPNNHRSYAVQWFLFALTALVIYALALRKRLAGSAPRG